MKPRASLLAKPLLFALAAGALISTGCSSLNLSSFSLKSARPPAPALTPGGPTFTVELHADSQKPRRATLPLSGPMLASQALAMARANDHFARFDAHIVRATPKGELKLPLPWNGKSGVVNPASDYSIYANDRLVIVENTNTPLGDMAEEALRPLAFMRK